MLLLLLLLLSPPLDRWPTFRLLLLLLLLLPPPPPQPQPQCSFAPVPRAKYHRKTFCADNFFMFPVCTYKCKVYLFAKQWRNLFSKTRVVVIGKRVLHCYYYPTTHIFVESNGRKQFPGAASACCCCCCGRPRHAFISRTLSLSFEEFPRKERPINLGKPLYQQFAWLEGDVANRRMWKIKSLARCVRRTTLSLAKNVRIQKSRGRQKKQSLWGSSIIPAEKEQGFFAPP